MIGGIRFEHTHRVIAGIVGTLTAVMAFLLFRLEKRRWVRNLGLIAFSAVLLQALLGGLTVIYLLPDWMSIAHACLAQTFFTLVVLLSWVTSKSGKYPEFAGISSTELRSLRRLTFITGIFIALQLLVGAVVRHAKGAGLTFHVALAFLVALHIALLIRKVSFHNFGKSLLTHTLFLGLVVLMQIFLGVGAFVFKWILPATEMPRVGQVLFTAAHQSNGAILLAAAVVLSLRSFRMTPQLS